MTRTKTLTTAFVAVVLALTLTVTTARPARAATVYGCSASAVCLYQWQNFGGDRWQSSLSNLYNQTNNCINLTQPAAYWDNGTKVWDNTAGIVVNHTNNGWTLYRFYYFDWANCNMAGNYRSFPMSQISPGGYYYVNFPPLDFWYHRITSVRIEYIG